MLPTNVRIGDSQEEKDPSDRHAGPQAPAGLMESVELHQGDALEVLRSLDSNSVDSIVADPPAGIAIMGADWDKDRGGRDEWIEWLRTVMSEGIRVLKAGGHAFVWALPRTSHWTAMALEDAGFEIRDSIHHAFGQGFPRSHSVQSALQKLDAPDAARRWGGFGTTLKPAHEVWWLGRKPLDEDSIARQVLATGTGGLNIDGCRVERRGKRQRPSQAVSGRFPPNLLLSHSPECRTGEPGTRCALWCPVAGLDEQSAETSRFFPNFLPFRYQAKPSKSQKNAGLEAFEQRTVRSGCSGGDMLTDDQGRDRDRFKVVTKNHHPTVKSLDLMRWLCRLITPPGGTVLDPFMGSGSTGCAAVLEGFAFVGVEMNEEYVDIAEARIRHWAEFDEAA